MKKNFINNRGASFTSIIVILALIISLGAFYVAISTNYQINSLAKTATYKLNTLANVGTNIVPASMNSSCSDSSPSMMSDPNAMAPSYCNNPSEPVSESDLLDIANYAMLTLTACIPRAPFVTSNVTV